MGKQNNNEDPDLDSYSFFIADVYDLFPNPNSQFIKSEDSEKMKDDLQGIATELKGFIQNLTTFKKDSITDGKNPLMQLLLSAKIQDLNRKYWATSKLPFFNKIIGFFDPIYKNVLTIQESLREKAPNVQKIILQSSNFDQFQQKIKSINNSEISRAPDIKNSTTLDKISQKDQIVTKEQ